MPETQRATNARGIYGPDALTAGAANLTTLTAFLTNVSYFCYLGRAADSFVSATVRCRVATAAVVITWAEVGIFTGDWVMAGNASLTRRGFTNVAAAFNALGLVSTVVSMSGIVPGADLWVAFGSQATTPYQLRAGLADDLASGSYQSVAGRISTVAVPVNAALAAATLAVPLVRVLFA